MAGIANYKARAWVAPSRVWPVLLLVAFALALALACGSAATPTPAPRLIPTASPTLSLAPTALPTPTVSPVSVKPTAERLVVALVPPAQETNLIWRLGGPASAEQLRRMHEYLLGIDPKTGAYTPMLARKWEIAPDVRKVTLWLRDDIPFHFGFGPFSAKDVVHSMGMLTQEGAINLDSFFWRAAIDHIEEVNEHQVAFHLKRMDPEIEYHLSAINSLLIMSKAQWDKEGLSGVERKPAGTAPYRYAERELGQYVRYQTADKHWRVTPDFKELELRFAREDATRLAMLLAGEAHIADIPRSLQDETAHRGMKIVSSQLPAIETVYFFGGLYYQTPEKFDPKLPWADTKVRRALNQAINRKEILDQVFNGRGGIQRIFFFHPAFHASAWNPEWDQRFEELYGYNPTLARKLLDEAGYAKGFRLQILSLPSPGVPEFPQVSDALFGYFKAVGLEPEIVELDGARVTSMGRQKEMTGILRSSFTGPGASWQAKLRVFHFSGEEGSVHGYESEFLDRKFFELLNTLDRAERDRIWREVGDHKFFEYTEIPLVWLNVDVVVNPKVVAEYVYPGNIWGYITHLEQVKAAR